jgi:Tol biopolymer transport system component
VLYELLTGELPFKGDHEAAITYQIVNVEAPLLSTVRPEAGVELDAVIQECLTKEAEERYEYAKEVSRQLKRIRLGTSEGIPGKRSTSSAGTPQNVRLEPDKPSWWISLRDRRLILGIGGVAAFAAIALLVIPRFLLQTPEINPGRAIRKLEIQSSNIGGPSLSADGNWVAFNASDLQGKWDVYITNAAGGNARRVTEDSALFGGATDLSPDGSHIVYDFTPASGGRSELRVTSTLGKQSRTIAYGGSVARWRPDGQRIGYVKVDAAGSAFWTIRPDGAENRMELTDSLVRGSFGFCWSPDGRSIAWLRPPQWMSPDGLDIYVRELESGNERRLTFDSTYIDDLSWGKNGQIVFSSNRRGVLDIWTINSAGGPPKQLTNGAQARNLRLSADCKRLAFSNNVLIGHIWIVPLGATRSMQVTFDELDTRWPALSPDGTRLAFMTFETGDRIFIANRDGTNRRQITSNEAHSAWPTWSPDGKWLAYTSHTASIRNDSVGLYIVEALDPKEPQFVAPSVMDGATWIDDTTISIPRRGGSRHVSINGQDREIRSLDSAYSQPILSGRFTLTIDLHAGKRGWWISGVDSPKHHSAMSARKVADFQSERVLVSRDQLFVIRQKQKEIYKLSVPSGRRERLKQTLPNAGLFFTGSIRYDGKELVYSDTEFHAQIMILENPFK